MMLSVFRVLIEDLVSTNALRIRGGHYMFGDNPIGHDLDSAILFLKEPKNQDIVLSLKAKLQSGDSVIGKKKTKIPTKVKKVESE